VRDIPGEPTGAYWDGGITDYHLHLDYASIGERLVVYPHFQKAIVPGWLDKALKHRHRASARLDNVVVLAPDPEWIATLPNAKLPDRGDFKRYGDDFDARVAAWSRATAESRRLADEFAEMVNRAGGIDAESLERALEVLLEVVAAPLSRVCIRSTRSCVLSAQTPRPVSDARPSRFGIDRSTRRMRPIMKRNRSQAHRLLPIVAALAATAAGLGISPADASSHREAPFITTVPKVDATDLYLFNSYEAGRDGYVTVLANYQPLQAPYGGPNYFKMDPNALYEIHIDNNGDAKEDITLQFRFKNKFNAIALDVGGKQVAIPLTQAGAVTGPNSPSLNVNEQYSVDIVRGDRRTGQRASITNMSGGSSTFDKPVDNIGTKTIPNYGAYADQHVYNVNIPGCTMPAKLFVGQRKDPFAVNLGVIFDLVNAPLAVITDPTLIGAAPNTIDDANVTTLGLEVHKSCLLAAGAADPVIGAWTTASLRQGQLLDPTPRKGHQTTAVSGGAWTQVSRLAMPLVNEVVIGLPDKDRFNGSKPKDDAQFADYVTNPTLPKLIEIAQNIPGAAPTNLPRTDLVTTFLTGIAGVNKPLNVVPSEMMRLNTAIPAVPFAQQNRLGIVGNILAGGNDNAGYPNGRRPKDDVVDISLVAVMGGLCVANGDTNALGFGAACKPSAVPLGATAFKLHDAVDQATAPFLSKFPYLFTPLPGATN